MPAIPAVILTLSIILTAGGCSRQAAPLADGYQKFITSLQPASAAADRLIQRARYYQIAGRLDLARAELEAGLEKDRANIKFLNMLGNICDQAGAFARAQECYENILAQDPANQVALNNLGYSHYLAGNLAKAENLLQDVVRRFPENRVARNNLGLVLCRLGREQEALALWEKTDGPEQAEERLQELLAYLGRTRQIPVAAGQLGSGPSAAPAPLETARRQPADQEEPGPAVDKPAAVSQATKNPGLKPGEGPPIAHKPPTILEEKAQPPVKVEEVALIVQPAAQHLSPESATALPVQPGKPVAKPSAPPPMVMAPMASIADDEGETEPKTALAASRSVKPVRPRWITLSGPDLPANVRPLREYIQKTHSQEIVPSAEPSGAEVY